MGGGDSYQEAGRRHHDTKAYNDEDCLMAIFGGRHPQTITSIRIWYSKLIVGFECFYDGISAGARMGSETYGVTSVDFIMSPGECITEVHGRAGDCIDMLGFKTSLGRSQTFGTSHGGHHFSLQLAGKIVKGFRVGFGGSLHFIGAHFGDMPAPSYGGAWP